MVKYLNEFNQKKKIGILAPIITRVINEGIDSEFMPNEFKISKTVPIFKSDNALPPSNYRPIIILRLVN